MIKHDHIMTLSRQLSKIKNILEQRTLRILDTTDLRPSAVLLLLMEINGELHVLVTRRSQLVGTHKGDMSLPGGGVEEQDKTLMETALRETWEETGIPQDQVEILGQFDDYRSIFGHHVTVIVGYIAENPEYTFNEEIDDYEEVPLQVFVKEAWDRKEIREYQEMTFDMYYYEFPAGTIWGLTARILTDFGREIKPVYESLSSS